MSTKVIPIPAFKDNYIWAIHRKEGPEVAIVDPGDPIPVLAYLKNNNYVLSDILITHHHWDHAGGLLLLMRQFGNVRAYGPTLEDIKGITHPVQEGASINLFGGELTLRVLDIPGHTRGHVAYVGNNLLFCGDTLFSCGCGKIFEGAAEQMYGSLNKLKKLSSTTSVYCGHEYTLANIQFAKHVMPNNVDLMRKEQAVMLQRQQNNPTLPSTLDEELKTNPFLRCDDPEIITAVQQHIALQSTDPVSIFAALREMKNHFTG